MTYGGHGRHSWFTHPCVSFLSCIFDGVGVLDLLEPPFSFTYILGRQLQHPHSPAPRPPSLLLLPTTTPAWIHAPPPSPPPQPFAPPGQFECAWTSGCVVWISWRCVCLECTQAERKTARRCGACQRGQVTEAGFCLALCCSCWLCIYYCCIGEALAQGRGGMLEAEWQLEGGARVTGTRRAAALVWSLSLWGFDVCQGAEQLSSHCARSPSLRSW
jgi:hypothetical protein